MIDTYIIIVVKPIYQLNDSRMKFLKSDWRSCLSYSRLSDQLLIASKWEPVGEFDPDHAVAHWESFSIRQRRPFFNDTFKPKVI